MDMALTISGVQDGVSSSDRCVAMTLASNASCLPWYASTARSSSLATSSSTARPSLRKLWLARLDF
jgi:hypothetical protein